MSASRRRRLGGPVRFVLIGSGVGIFILLGLIVRDVTATPPATKGQCLLTRRVVLPDICVNSCKTPFNCTTTTRPYAVFFTQSATCADAVICD